MVRMLNATVRWAVLGIGVLALSGPGALRIDHIVGAAASCPPPPGANPIVVENCSPGNKPSEWDLPGGMGSASIQGFTTDISVNKGDVVHFKVDVNPAGAFHLDIYRLGYYGGLGARKIATIAVSSGAPQSACLTDPTSGLIDCGNWTESAAWPVPLNATSGLYVAKAVRDSDPLAASHIVFIVRDDASRSDLLVQTSDTTWQAYNAYGGKSLYAGAPGSDPARAYKVSYNRPITTRDGVNARSFVFSAEYPMVRWLEANGYDVSYVTGLDGDRMGLAEAGAPPASMMLNHRVFLSVGHDEYWSGTQRANVEAARAAGTHLAFFSGNEIYWKTRWENSIDGSNAPHRTLVSYKETWQAAKIDPSPAWTGTWRDPRFSPPADGGRPENGLIGQLYTVDSGTSAITVPAADGVMRLWRSTSVASLAPNTSATFPSGTLGYEWDEDLDNGSRPAGIVLMSTTTVSVPARIVDYGRNFAPGVATHHLTLYRHNSGALVFGAGTIQWSWGLDGVHDGGGSTADVRMQQATVNLLADMGAQAGSLQPGLMQTTASSDAIAPSSTVTSPTSGFTAHSDTPTTITGTASDLGGGVVGGVEVSVDDGATWHPADGRESWSYTWTPGAQGTATIKSRSVDDTGNIEAPSAGVPVTIGPPSPPNCPCSIWTSSTTPANASSNDPSAVEVGVRFRASVNGFISAIRFHKGTSNTGTHVGHLWTNTGTLLGTATFSGETTSGWQEAALPSPVAITAGTTYVASYHTNVGGYSFDSGYFTARGKDTPPLHALQDGVDGPAGVYGYGPGTFPTNTFRSTNYWADVVFITSVPPDTTPPAIGNIHATIGTNGSTTITWTTDQDSTSGVDYGKTASELTSNVSDSTLVTSHRITLTGLAPTTTYFFRVASADAAGNSASSPPATDPPATFTTSDPVFGDTLAADFSAGTTGSNTYVSETANGEVILSPTIASEFSGAALPSAWQGAPWSAAQGGSGTGTVTVANGGLTVDGARAGSTAAFASGRSLEFVATFTGQAFQHVGFAKDFAFNTPFAMFTTIGGGQLSARSIGAADTSTALAGSFLGAPHRYRIDWSADSAVFSIDDNVVATHAFAVAGAMVPIASDFNTGSGAVAVDWMRLTPYASSGAFISRVFDAGVMATWGALSWTARTPSGTSVSMSVSASDSPTPATSCTGFTPISGSGDTIGISSRFIQYCAQLSTPDVSQTPSLDDVTIGFSTGATIHQTSASVSCTPSTVPVNGTTTCTTSVTDTADAGGTTPAGSVTFSADSGAFGGGGTCSLDAAASCSVTYTATVAGWHTLAVSYSGESTHATSSGSASVTTTVRSTSASVSCAPTALLVNGTTTCTATVADIAGSGATTPTGTVTFSADNGTFNGGGTCSLDAGGSCSVTYTATVVGPHALAVSYGGDTTHAMSSGNTSVTTTARSTDTSVSCAPSTVAVDGTTTCTVTVTDTSGAGETTPTGTVKVTSDGGKFNRGGNCTLDATGRCSVTYTVSVVGSYTVTSSYRGDSTHAVSNGSTPVTATTRSTSTSVSCTPTTVPVNGTTTCTATVTDTSGAGGTTPTDTVTLTSDSGTFSGGGNCTLDATGRCSVTYTPTVVGPHTITSSYKGDSRHAVSSGTTAVTATTRSTSTSVSCSPALVVLNVATTCTATVTDTAGAGATTPTGTVAFSSSGGLFLLGATCSLNATGRCSVSYTPSLLGSSTVTGSYGGAGRHASSSGSTTVTSVIGLGLGLASPTDRSPTDTRITNADVAEDR